MTEKPPSRRFYSRRQKQARPAKTASAVLGFALLAGDAPELAMVHAWLETWDGIGLIAGGMARQGYDPSLTRYDERLRRTRRNHVQELQSPPDRPGMAPADRISLFLPKSGLAKVSIPMSRASVSASRSWYRRWCWG